MFICYIVPRDHLIYKEGRAFVLQIYHSIWGTVILDDYNDLSIVIYKEDEIIANVSLQFDTISKDLQSEVIFGKRFWQLDLSHEILKYTSTCLSNYLFEITSLVISPKLGATFKVKILSLIFYLIRLVTIKYNKEIGITIQKVKTIRLIEYIGLKIQGPYIHKVICSPTDDYWIEPPPVYYLKGLQPGFSRSIIKIASNLMFPYLDFKVINYIL